MAELIYKDESYAIIGACFEVYKDKGCGFVEPVYQKCLEIEFEFQKIPFVAQQCLDIFYRVANWKIITNRILFVTIK